MQHQVIEMTPEKALNTPSQEMFRLNSIYVEKSHIPLNKNQAKIVYFVLNDSGEDLGQSHSLVQAIDLAMFK